MKPAATDELVEGLQVLFAALPSSNAGEATELRMRAYLLALGNVSAAALREVVTAILRGETSLENPRFVPVPPELATLCREAESRMMRKVEHLWRIEAKQNGEPAFTAAPSPETRAKVADGFKRLSASLVIPLSPQTAEK